MADKRNVAIAIGVRGADPLPYLPAALNAARDFAEWATALGYDTVLLTDDGDGGLTVDRLKIELHKALGAKAGPIHRLVLYFAGHGLIREVEQGLWLLTDWKQRQEAVSMDKLKRRLARYDIRQVAIISDCCQSLPKDAETTDLDLRGVLNQGPGAERTMPDVDKFVAAQDGKEAYAVPGDTEDKDRCIFSGVLIEGLWGTKPEAFSIEAKDRITSRSLGKYLKKTVPDVAKRYGRKLDPTCIPSFPEGDDVYFISDSGFPRPTLPDWPPPESVAPMGPTALAPADSDIGIDGLVPRSAPRGSRKPSASRKGFDRAVESRATLLERMQQQNRPDEFETRSGFAVEGARIVRLWAPEDVTAKPDAQEGWWNVGDKGKPLNAPAPILIELENGQFAAVAALPDFVGAILTDDRGVAALVYHAMSSRGGAISAELALDQLERGALRADVVTDLAVNLRMQKHVDPVLGVISAYLYDSISDTDNIRRMAFYYTQHQQPIPFDIALLAHLEGKREGGQLTARIPKVAARKPRTDTEARYSWTHESTPASEGVVGGLWPWMKQGWALLDDDEDDSTLVLPDLLEVRRDLTGGRFATLKMRGAKHLIARLKLEPREPPSPRQKAARIVRPVPA